jgi:phenylacetate-CoA ligase
MQDARVKLVDLLSGKRIWSYLKEYRRTQWLARADLDRLRVGKLRRLLAHCQRNVPFYRELLQAASIRVDRVDSLSVLRDLPVLDKTKVVANHSRIRSEEWRGLGPLRVTQTGGTTGQPLRIVKDAFMRSSALAAMYRFHEWMGVRLGDPKVVVWGAPLANPGVSKMARDWVLSRITNTQSINSFSLSRHDLPHIRTVIQSHHAVLLHGYCQSIYQIARWLGESGTTLPLRAVSTTVEPLFPEYRSTFREVFNCETFDQYGCGEVEAIAMECDRHQGLHVVEERVVLELEDDGRVIVTDLDNLVFPFIRYANGDQAVLADGPCGCGRVHMRVARIVGRIGDIVEGPNGRQVHPEFFTHLLNETGVSYRAGLTKYQVYQESVNRLTWKLAAKDVSENDKQLLEKEVRRHLGNIDLTIDVVEDIPVGKSGKFQYVVTKR